MYERGKGDGLGFSKDMRRNTCPTGSHGPPCKNDTIPYVNPATGNVCCRPKNKIGSSSVSRNKLLVKKAGKFRTPQEELLARLNA